MSRISPQSLISEPGQGCPNVTLDSDDIAKVFKVREVLVSGQTISLTVHFRAHLLISQISFLLKGALTLTHSINIYINFLNKLLISDL